MLKFSTRTACFLLPWFLGLPLFAQDVNDLLQTYTEKNVLSQRTVDENKGHLVLFTREKLEKMHAKTLKDVFKTTPIIYYNENRYGVPDPLTLGGFEPYKSNFIRLYVDGVEITQGWAGSGLLMYGDVNIDFVDHIEFYYMTPSFESTVEPAFLTIYLYSKDPKRDSGNKIDLIGGSRGYNMQSYSYGQQHDDVSYMINISHTDAKRKKIDNGTPQPLSRDFERMQLFSYIKSEDQTFHLQIMQKNTDSFAGASWDATPLLSEMDFFNLHMDYSIQLSEAWYAAVSYDYFSADTRAIDDLPLVWEYPVSNRLFTKTTNSTLSAELTYKKRIGDHRINAGFKARNKQLDEIKLDGRRMPLPAFDTERVFSVFLQDRYTLDEKQLLSLGASYNYISRNGKVTDDNLLQLRMGYIFADEHWGYKAYLYRTQIALEPMIRGFYPDATEKLTAQTTWGITQEVSYTKEKQHLRLMAALLRDEQSLLIRLRDSHADDSGNYFLSLFDYDYTFSPDDKVNIQLHYGHYNNVYDIDSMDNMGGYFSLFNTYEALDFYNGVVWHKDSLDKKNYFDWTSSVTWNISDSLTVTLKGENLLDKAVESNILRLDITTMPPTMLAPLQVPQYDRRITFELEYLF